MAQQLLNNRHALLMLINVCSSEIKKHLKLINKSKTTEVQLKELKRFGKLIAPENSKEQNEKIAKKLITIFFEEKLKHPAKSAIQR